MDGVSLEETGFRFVPLVGFDGDVVFEEESRFGGRSTFSPVKVFDGTKDAVNGGWRNSEDFLGQIDWQITILGLIETDPVRECGLKAF